MRDFFSHADICKQSEKQIVRKKEYSLEGLLCTKSVKIEYTIFKN